MQVFISLQTDNHTSTPPLSFLQAGWPSCRPTNSVKALKAQIYTICSIISRIIWTGKGIKSAKATCWIRELDAPCSWAACSSSSSSRDVIVIIVVVDDAIVGIFCLALPLNENAPRDDDDELRILFRCWLRRTFSLIYYSASRHGGRHAGDTPPGWILNIECSLSYCDTYAIIATSTLYMVRSKRQNTIPRYTIRHEMLF